MLLAPESDGDYSMTDTEMELGKLQDANFDGIDMEQAKEELNIPDDPGLAVQGNTPVLGSLRRKNDMPVLRDELKDQI